MRSGSPCANATCGFSASSDGSSFNFSGNIPNAGGSFDPGDSDFSSASSLQPWQGVFDNTALILVPLLLVATGAVGTFNHAYWTPAYLRLVSRDGTPEGRASV